MRLRLQAKGVILLFSLFILLLLIQFYFFFSLKTSLLFSSFLALCLMAPGVFLLVRSLIKPILALTRKAKEWASDSLTQRTLAHSDDELEDLSKTITEVTTQLRIKSDEITREKEYHQALLGGMAEGVILVDGKGRILLVNDALQKLLSISSRSSTKYLWKPFGMSSWRRPSNRRSEKESIKPSKSPFLHPEEKPLRSMSPGFLLFQMKGLQRERE